MSSVLRRQSIKPFISTKPVGQGTGPGLSIYNDMGNNHGGVINIDSRQGEYTKALIDLPVATEETNEQTQHHKGSVVQTKNGLRRILRSPFR
jgi:nitrogen-specific signal transduction histidine kinase